MTLQVADGESKSQMKPLGWSLSEAPEEPHGSQKRVVWAKHETVAVPGASCDYFTKLNGVEDVTYHKTAQNI